MKGLPFNADQALAIWEGRQSVTRRPMKEQPFRPLVQNADGNWRYADREGIDPLSPIFIPPYSPGEVVYMQEPWGAIDLDVGYALAPESLLEIAKLDIMPKEVEVIYQAGCSDFIESLVGDESWLSPVTMPQWASRLHLKLTVRPERLWEITYQEVCAEGWSADDVKPWAGSTAKFWFKKLWDSIYGKKYPWSSNPYIWRYGMEEVWRR